MVVTAGLLWEMVVVSTGSQTSPPSSASSAWVYGDIILVPRWPLDPCRGRKRDTIAKCWMSAITIMPALSAKGHP